MNNKNLFYNLFNSTKINEIILITILGIIFFKFLTYEHYPESDEVVSITILSSLKTSLIKFWGHNHFLSTQIGNIIISIFGVDIMKIRLISLFSFFLIILLIQKHFKDHTKTFIYVLIYLYVDLIITYFSLYRGYGFSALMSSLMFVLLDNPKTSLQNSKLLYFIMTISIFNTETIIYLVLPILLSLNFYYFKRNKQFQIKAYKNFILFFLVPFSSLLLMFSFTEGLYNAKIFVSYSNINDVAPIIFNNFFDLIYNGFSRLIYNEANSVTLSSHLFEFAIYIKNNPILFLLFLISFLKSIFFIFLRKKNDLIDLIVFIFFITFILINRNGPPRIYTGFVSFFIFYLLRDFNLFLFDNKIFYLKKVFNFAILFLIILKLDNLEFVRLDVLKEKYLFFKKNLNNCNFPTKKHPEEFDKHFEYFVYMQECRKKPDINKFYYYYKS